MFHRKSRGFATLARRALWCGSCEQLYTKVAVRASSGLAWQAAPSPTTADSGALIHTNSRTQCKRKGGPPITRARPVGLPGHGRNGALPNQGASRRLGPGPRPVRAGPSQRPRAGAPNANGRASYLGPGPRCWAWPHTRIAGQRKGGSESHRDATIAEPPALRTNVEAARKLPSSQSRRPRDGRTWRPNAAAERGARSPPAASGHRPPHRRDRQQRARPLPRASAARLGWPSQSTCPATRRSTQG